MVDLDFKGLSELKGTGAPIRKQPAESSELQRAADEAKSKIETAADVLKQYQAASILTSKLQSEILIGVRQGENIYTLFLKAVKALSLDTGNRLLYRAGYTCNIWSRIARPGAARNRAQQG